MIMLDLNSLNTNQKKAVLHNQGPLMILAGAGSGKTRTLVAKIGYLIDQMQLSPYKVLALTFSNKAAREMRERVALEVNADIGALQVTTFHAFCAKLLRSEARHIGLSQNFTIYDKSESKAIAKNILARHGISSKETSPFELLYFIDDLKNYGHYPELDKETLDYEVDENDPFYQYYLEYEQELRKANALDFGGLICAVVQLLERHPQVCQRYQKKFEYILIDEYQDTNRAQFKLLCLLAGTKKNVCVVGDEDQSIYSWRGADIRNILDFEDYFKGADIIKLEQNYRSSKRIIEAASAVISQNSQRKGKNMWTENPEGEYISIIECESDKTEAQYVAGEIKKLKSQGVPYSEMAVFYRTNAQSRIVEDQLRKESVSYRIVGGIKFYERKEIKDILAYLKLIVNPKDSLSLSRVVNVPARGIGATTLKKLEAEALDKGISLYEAIVHIVENPQEYKHLRLSAKVRSSLQSFCFLIQESQLLEKEGDDPVNLYEKVLYESGLWDFIKSMKDYEAQARLENLQELQSAITQYAQQAERPKMSEFLESITLDATNDEDREENLGEVSMMTIHGAKGLEFHYVFVIGIEENIFPSYRSLEQGDDLSLEEERRLFYVAMTRAMKRLHLCYANSRMLFGQVKFNGPSRFLDEIPSDYYEWHKGKGVNSENWAMNSRRHTGDEYDEYSQESPYQEKIYQVESAQKQSADQVYCAGIKVRHGLYGDGVVVDSDGLGADEKVTIKFRDGVHKKFMVKFAPLEIISQ